MNIIAAIDKSYGIGREGGLLYRIPEDMRLFKRLTLNKVVVMGHNTCKSLPHGGPLPDRINIVLSRDPHVKVDAAVVCTSLGGLKEAIKSYNTDDIFIIGGQALYGQMQPYCRRAFITLIDSHTQADCHFFHIHECANWREIKRSDEKEFHHIKYTFAEYVNTDVKTM